MTSPTSDDRRRRQIVYRAGHRGIREMDLLLGPFAARQVHAMSESELTVFEQLLEESDRDLLSWFTGERAIPDHVPGELVEAVLAFRREQF